MTNYEYNNRGLVTGITWNVGSTGVTGTAAVGFDYDNLGNRTEMTDGLGTQTYEYDELSRLTAETRSFTDTLVNAPLPDNSFRLEYTYHLAGQLKSLKDPYGQQINYANDRTGRLSTVTGSSFGGVTSYAYDPAYRAWGGLKHLKFGSANQITIDYNDRLAPMSFVANQISAPTNKLFDKTYDYFADGRISLIDENISLLDKFDRSFSYDHLGRVKDAKSGIEAHGGTETDLTKLPFRQTYSYNAFDNLTGRDSTLWDYGDWSFSYTMSNNRVAGSGYDADGREYSSETDDGDVIFFTYNAAGRIVKTERYYDRYETLLAQTGDGGEAKRSQRTFDTELEQWGDWETVYFITSSVFGRVISEATATGKKRHTYVMGGGMEIARQFLSDSDVETVDFGITDPSGYSSRGSGGIMSPYKQEELDGLGNNVGTFAVPNRPEKIGNTMTPTQGVTFDDVTFGQCQLDGIMVPCSFISRSIEAIQMEIRDGTTVIRKDLSGDLPGRGTFTTLVVTETNIRMRDEEGNLIKNDDHGFREFWLDFHDVYIPEDTTGLPFHHPVSVGPFVGVPVVGNSTGLWSKERAPKKNGLRKRMMDECLRRKKRERERDARNNVVGGCLVSAGLGVVTGGLTGGPLGALVGGIFGCAHGVYAGGALQTATHGIKPNDLEACENEVRKVLR
ncbi:MAG: RHS repeat protein [Acidobacteria bacterium]|nr:RHS repeat protein [Acidobacteriota bacterium]